MLALCMRLLSAAQSNTTTPAMQQPAAGPPPGPGAQLNRMTPTGLAANGGSLAHDLYTNSLYGFSLKTPPGWAVVPSQNATANLQSTDATVIKAAQLNRTLLIMTENAPLKKPYERKSLQILATHLSTPPTPTAALDYLSFSEKNVKEKGMPVEYAGDPEEVTINGQKFAKVSLKETTNGMVRNVEQYVITRGGSLLQFLLVSPEASGLKELEPSIQSLEFKEPAKQPPSKRTAKGKTPAPKSP